MEEQFYLLWPFILWLGLWALPERRPGSGRRPALAVATLVLAAGSAVAMALLYHPGFDQNRVYDGTDTRAFGLLIGAALAAVWPSRQRRASKDPKIGLALDAVGVAGLVVIGLLVWRTNQYSAFPYRGGMVLLSFATGLVVLAVVHPGSWLGRVLGIRPLRWLGVRSYGIYLWHFPIIVLTARAVAGRFDLPRASLEVLATVVLAALSWRFIEEPILRGGRLPRLSPASWYRARRVQLDLGHLHGGFGLSDRHRADPGRRGLDHYQPVVRVRRNRRRGRVFDDCRCNSHGGPAGEHGRPLLPCTASPATLRFLRPIRPRPFRPLPELAPGSATMSSCRSVVHIGDSTSESLISSDYLPDPSQRLQAQYARVGVVNQYMEIEGGTSIVETIPGEPNAYDLAKALVAGGYRGCWVIALGTNDTADVYVGSNVSLATRIQRMMSVIGNQPAMWVNVRSLVASGPYSETDMQKWNQALVQACSSYPNMRVYDWASVVSPSWFIPDGIHYSSPGSAERAQLIASALAEAFPAAGQRGYSGCVVP